jgi:hypothetical protein
MTVSILPDKYAQRNISPAWFSRALTESLISFHISSSALMIPSDSNCTPPQPAVTELKLSLSARQYQAFSQVLYYPILFLTSSRISLRHPLS